MNALALVPDTHRCSSTPRFIECASSEQITDTPYNPTTDEAAMGHAAHEAMQKLVDGEDVSIEGIAAKWKVDATELMILYAYGVRAWKQLKKFFPKPSTEVKTKSSIFRGTIDVLHYDGETAVVLDWKSGRVRRSGAYQVMSYAQCVRAELGMPASGKITTVVVWLQFGEIDVYNMEDPELDEFEAMIDRRRKDIGRQYSPGEHCAWCPRYLECAARVKYLRAAVDSFQDLGLDAMDDETAALEFDPDFLGSIYTQVKAIEQAAKTYRRALRIVLESEGRDIPIGDNRAAHLGSQTRYAFDTKAAWSALKKAGFDQDEIAQCLKLSKTKFQDIAAEKAGHGNKGRARKEILETLVREGAAFPYKTKKLQIVRAETPAVPAAQGGSK